LGVLCERERPLSEVGRPFEPLPQRLRNVRTRQRIDLKAPAISRLIEAEQGRLANRGRLLVRASGTEPVIRVMVEADDEGLLGEVLDRVSGEIEREAARI
jgi:phosphoglucosamine mutase